MHNHYIPRSDLKPNMWLIADSGFKCICPSEMKRVLQDEKGKFFVECECGRHMLTEDNYQIDGRGRVIGFYRCEGMN